MGHIDFMKEAKEQQIECAVNNVSGIKIYNIMRTFNSWIGGPYPHRCCVGFEMRRVPTFKEYHFLENKYLVAKDNSTGCVSAYKYNKGTTEGFAGREIVLPVLGRGIVFKNKGVTKVHFKGSLWDSCDAWQKAADFFDIEVVNSSYRHVNERGCHISIYVDKRVFDLVFKMAGISMVGPSYRDKPTNHIHLDGEV